MLAGDAVGAGVVGPGAVGSGTVGVGVGFCMEHSEHSLQFFLHPHFVDHSLGSIAHHFWQPGLGSGAVGTGVAGPGAVGSGTVGAGVVFCMEQ